MSQTTRDEFRILLARVKDSLLFWTSINEIELPRYHLVDIDI